MSITVTPIVIGALGMASKGFEERLVESEIRGRIETIQTTALLSSTRIPRRVLETWGDLLSLLIPVKKKHQLTLVRKFHNV